MRLLLDTHTFIWHREGNDRLSALAGRMISDSDNEVFISIVTLWEMSIKRSSGKLATAKSPLEYLEIYQQGGAELLTVLPNHVMAVESLPFHHRDPFDRMLIVQAQQENLTLITVDEVFSHYDVPTIW
jgi:PIN domain nuclease of toxin-antitoxin system